MRPAVARPALDELFQRVTSRLAPRLLIEKAMLPAWAILVSFIESGISGFAFTDNANSTQRWIVSRP
jgi:hypothetical protein